MSCKQTNHERNQERCATMKSQEFKEYEFTYMAKIMLPTDTEMFICDIAKSLTNVLSVNSRNCSIISLGTTLKEIV